MGATEGLPREACEDAAANRYNPPVMQPMIVLAADTPTIATIYRRAMERGVGLALREDKKLVDKTTKGARMHP